MKQNSIFFYFMLVILAVTVASSCDKDEETKEYISGTITFDLPGYCYIEDVFDLKMKTDIIDPTEGVRFFWSSTNDEILKDSLELPDFEMVIPDSIGSYSITAYAQADGYYSNAHTRTVVAIDTTFDVSVQGIARSIGSGVCEDDRDGISYFTEKIGSLHWFSQNLRYEGEEGAPVGLAYDNEEVLADVFGRLYTWDEATGGVSSTGLGAGVQGICPEGWSVPTKEDWEDFGKALNGDIDIAYDDIWTGLAGKAIGEASLNGAAMWPYNYEIDRSNDFYWNGIPAGNLLYSNDEDKEDDIFENLLLYGTWWSATQASETQASYRYIYYNNDFFAPHQVDKKEFGASVRCVKPI